MGRVRWSLQLRRTALLEAKMPQFLIHWPPPMAAAGRYPEAVDTARRALDSAIDQDVVAQNIRARFLLWRTSNSTNEDE